MDLGECAERFKFLVRGRAGQFTATFDAVKAAAGVVVVESRREVRKPRRARLPKLEQLPNPATAALRSHLADYRDTADQEAPSHVHGVSPRKRGGFRALHHEGGRASGDTPVNGGG